MKTMLIHGKNETKNISRLAIILCILQLFLSFNFSTYNLFEKQKDIPSARNGIGGGSIAESVIEASAVSLESGVLEPETFSRPRMLAFDSYLIQSGDIIGNLAAEFGLNQDTLISANGIRNTRLIQVGHTLKIPNQDGIFYSVKNGDSLSSISERYNTDTNAIMIANELFSDNISSGVELFLPGAKLDSVNLQEINGDLFMWPVSGRITSSYGYRANPFTGVRQFHSGMDISSNTGTPIRAAMSGRVSAAGYDNVLGNYVAITHHSGYRTLYGHMSMIRVRPGAYVGTGERIGDVGSTGVSTGPHLHFTVFKNGITVNPRTLMR